MSIDKEEVLMANHTAATLILKKAPYYYLILLTVMGTIRSLIHMFASDSGAMSIAGIPIEGEGGGGEPCGHHWSMGGQSAGGGHDGARGRPPLPSACKLYARDPINGVGIATGRGFYETPDGCGSTPRRLWDLDFIADHGFILGMVFALTPPRLKSLHG